MPEPIRVLVADDHLLVREGVRQLLELEDDVRVVGTAGDVHELLSAVTDDVDVVVTDIRMPPYEGSEGIEAAHLLRARRRIGVVVLSAYAEAAYALDLFRDGTEGLAYLLKDRIGERRQLADAVRAVADGGSVVDPVVVEAMVQRSRPSRLERLTARERDVLAAMATGHSNPRIAEVLHLSVSAVEKHVGSIFTKLDLAEEPATHRRVAAVLAWLGDA